MLRTALCSMVLVVAGCTAGVGDVDGLGDPPDASVDQVTTCEAPPAATCSSANVLRTYSSPGAFSDGGCDYPVVDVQCDAGCSGGQCQPDPCANVTCNPTDVCQAGTCVPKPPPSDVTTYPYDGVSYTTGVKNGVDFILTIADPAKVRFEVRHVDDSDNRDIPSRVAASTKAQLVVNGCEYDKHLSGPYFPKLPAISNGVKRSFTDPDGAQPRIIFPKTGSPYFDTKTNNSAWNMLTGMRYLMKDGAILSYVYSTTNPSYTEKHSRTILGLDASGKVMVLVASKYPGTTKGLTFLECCELMQKYGAATVMDVGGGGDSALIKDGVLQNVPDDFNSATGVHGERGVVQFLATYVN